MTVSFSPGHFKDLAEISFARIGSGPNKNQTEKIQSAARLIDNFLGLAQSNGDSVLVKNALRTASGSLVGLDSIDNHPYLDLAWQEYTRNQKPRTQDTIGEIPDHVGKKQRTLHFLRDLPMSESKEEQPESSDIKFGKKDVDILKKRLDDITGKEIESMVSDIDSFDDIEHLYEESDEICEPLEEHISRQERIRKSVRFEKTEAKREIKRKIALERASSTPKLVSKARKLAIQILKEKILHKSMADMTLADKERIEDIIAKRKDVIARMVTKLVPKIRKIEQDRIKKHHVKEEIVQEEVLDEVLVISPTNINKNDKLTLGGYLGGDTYENIEDSRSEGKRDFKDLGEFKEMHAHMTHNEMFPNEGFHVFAHNKYHDGDSKTSMVMEGKFNPANHDVMHVEKTATDGNNANKAHDLYAHLILNHGKTLVSDTSQSEGGVKLWQNLAKHPDITVHGWDMDKDREFNLPDNSLSDTSETHLRSNMIPKDDPSEKNRLINKFKNVVLVAHRK